MGIFSRIFGKSNSGITMPTYIVYTSDGRGLILSKDQAERVGTVYSCVNIISESVSTLPIHVKYSKDGKVEILRAHPVSRLLLRPNPMMNGIDFRRAMIIALVMRGNAYAHISERDRLGYPTRLDYLDPDTVSPMAGKNDLYYAVAGIDGLIPSRDMLHLKGYAPDGIEGKSPIALHQDAIENNANATLFSKNLFKNDLKSTGVFSTDGTLTKDSYERLRSQLVKAWKRLGTSPEPLVLEAGTKVQTLTITPEDAQFVTTKLQSIDEIAAIFRVPPHKVGDWTRGTYANNTQANLEFFTDCIRPLLAEIEEEFNYKLFLSAEDGYYVDINFKGLLRTDVKTQIENYRTLFNIGVYSANDIRKMEDLPPYEGGDKYLVPVNMAVNDNNLTSIKDEQVIE